MTYGGSTQTIHHYKEQPSVVITAVHHNYLLGGRRSPLTLFLSLPHLEEVQHDKHALVLKEDVLHHGAAHDRAPDTVRGRQEESVVTPPT